MSKAAVIKIKELLHLGQFKTKHPQAFRNYSQWAIATNQIIYIPSVSKLNDLTNKICNSNFVDCYYVGGDNESIFNVDHIGYDEYEVTQIYLGEFPSPPVVNKNDLDLFLAFIRKNSL
jgi:hypothetical protein